MPDPFFDFFYKKEHDNNSAYGPARGKAYPHMPELILPDPLPLGKKIDEVLLSRRTCRSFSRQPVTTEMLGTLLWWSMGSIHKAGGDTHKRPYPSGGALYPIEAYLAIFNAEAIKPGVYHYNFYHHSLENLIFADVNVIKSTLKERSAREAAFVIMLSFIKHEAEGKYGNLSYKLGILEAGHIGQNICLIAESLGSKTLPLGSIDYSFAEKELNFDEGESGVYEIAIGYEQK